MTLDALHIILGLIALAAAGTAFVFSQRKAPDTAHLQAELEERKREAGALKSERDDLRGRAEKAEKAEAAVRASLEASDARAADARTTVTSLTDQLKKLQADHALAQAEAARTAEREASFAREKAEMQKMQAESEKRFQTLAEQALLKSQQQFVQIADETLKKHKEGAEGELGKMLKPIQESIGEFKLKVDAIQKDRTEDRTQLAEHMRQISETARLAHEATGKLTVALTAPKGGGRWGEETLKNVLEMAGLTSYADFSEQEEVVTEEGKWRPDVIVRMAGGRKLAIDSKVSLEDYLAASGEVDPARRSERLSAHAAKVRAHVTRLGAKGYGKKMGDAIDFVAMFIPGENFYAAVLEEDREIFDYAARNNVVIVTPSTLIALAKSVAYGWRQEQVAKNVEQATKLGRDLYERIAKMCEHMDKVGGGLVSATKSYNEMVGSLESRVLPAARKFEELQFSDPTKPIKGPAQVEVAPRQLALLEAPDSGTPGGKRK